MFRYITESGFGSFICSKTLLIIINDILIKGYSNLEVN